MRPVEVNEEVQDQIPECVDDEIIKKASIMNITKCPHTTRKHYAKNMCASCYRKNGRGQLTWACKHTERLNYSMGMCQTCYLADYNKRRNKTKKKEDDKAKNLIERSVYSVSPKSIANINAEIGEEIERLNKEEWIRNWTYFLTT